MPCFCDSVLKNNTLGDIWLAGICSHVLAGIVYCFPLERASFLQVFLDIEKILKMDNDEYCTGETTGLYRQIKSIMLGLRPYRIIVL